MPTLHKLHTPALHALGRAIADASHRLLVAWKRRRRARQAYQALVALDDRTLRDLGFTRSELQSVASLPNDRERMRRRCGL